MKMELFRVLEYVAKKELPIGCPKDKTFEVAVQATYSVFSNEVTRYLYFLFTSPKGEIEVSTYFSDTPVAEVANWHWQPRGKLTWLHNSLPFALTMLDRMLTDMFPKNAEIIKTTRFI